MLPVICIAFCVLSIVAFAIYDMQNRTEGFCEPVEGTQITQKEIFVDRNGYIIEVDVNDIPVFLKLHAGEYEDFFLDAENVTIT